MKKRTGYILVFCIVFILQAKADDDGPEIKCHRCASDTGDCGALDDGGDLCFMAGCITALISVETENGTVVTTSKTCLDAKEVGTNSCMLRPNPDGSMTGVCVCVTPLCNDAKHYEKVKKLLSMGDRAFPLEGAQSRGAKLACRSVVVLIVVSMFN